ncbi:hypothetical protein [Effusibacillus dendaii]|uniref:Uncharacterized protein n=1 Tax=Effusibacillus dendaii TaxID=2743772 RepID=A0A7I8DDC7_9BACL|nr:hypothetical protein [Effusibacillus dendaii]BCJ86530.1 hypothetical protein skT53_15150 [Effusibacillus dendaii]
MKRGSGRIIRFFQLFILCLSLLQVTPAAAWGQQENQVIVVVIPGLKWDLLSSQATPHLLDMAAAGGAANVSIPVRKTEGIEAAESLIRQTGGRVERIGPETVGEEQMYKRYLALRDHSNLLTVQFNRLERLTERQQLKAADRFVGNLLQDVDLKHLLLVTSDLSTAGQDRGPCSAGILLVSGGGVDPNSLLSSNGTRQIGLVSVRDMNPTILAHLGLPEHPNTGGEVIGSLMWSGSTLPYLQDQVHQISLVNRVRPYMVKGFVFGMLVVLIGSISSRLAPVRFADKWGVLLTGLLTMPSVFLLLPILGYRDVADLTVKCGILSAILFVALTLFKTQRGRLFFLSAMTVGLVLPDLLQQGYWMKNSVLGYDLLAGDRYYGIGNEYMGILIGAVLLLYYLASQRYVEWKTIIQAFSFLVFGAIIYLLASPRLGTNAGGAVAASIAFMYVAAVERAAIFYKKWVWVVAGTAVLASGILAINLLVPYEQQSHIGRICSLLLNGGFDEFFAIIHRKWLLNWYLLRVSPWGMLLCVTLLVLFAHQFWTDWFRTLTPAEGRMVQSFAVAALAVFLLNDSGVIAATGVLLFAAVTVLTNAMVKTGIIQQAIVADNAAKDDREDVSKV